MSVFHSANPPEPNKQHGPIRSWVFIVQISHGKATLVYHSAYPDRRVVRFICLESSSCLLARVCLYFIEYVHPSYNLALSRDLKPKGVGGWWYGR